MVHHLPTRRSAADSARNQALDVLAQMYAYFDYADLPFVKQDDTDDYNRAA